MYARKFAAFGFILLLLVVAGCGPREQVVARVGREPITVSQFKTEFIQQNRGEENARQRSIQDREKALREMAIGLAKYEEGVALGIDKQPMVKAQIENVAKRKALDLLYQARVLDVVITDASAKKFYDHSSKEVRARHILLKYSPQDSSRLDSVKVQARADSILKAINNGLQFGAAAKLFSEDPTTAADSGELGWFPWGRMVGEFEEVIWNSKPGQIIGPVHTPYGYHLIQLEETRPVQDRRPYEEMKDEIKSQMREAEGEKMNEIAKKYVADLRDKRHLKYNQATLDMFRKRVQDPSISKSAGLAPVFTDDQKHMVAATFDGGKLIVDSLISKVGSGASRVDWNDPQSMTDLCNAIVEPRFLEEDAEKAGFLRKAMSDPEVVAEKRRGVAGFLEKQEVTDKIQPTDTDLQKFYQTHLVSYIQPEMRTVREIFIKTDSLKALRISERGKKGENFTKLALRFNEKESTKPDTGRVGPMEQKRLGFIGHAAFMLEKIGDVSEVIPVGTNFSVIQLLNIIPSRTKTFEEARTDVERMYRTSRTEELMTDLGERLLKKYKYEPDAKALAAVWPLTPEPANKDKKVAREP